jgi:hypothetical protein
VKFPRASDENHATGGAGTIRNRSRDRYKPSALRGYEHALKTRVLPDLGGLRLSEVRRVDLQDFADRLFAQGLDPSMIRNALMPLRAIYRRALSRGDVSVNPTTGLELPAVRGRRDRIATPQEAAALLAALPKADRAVWVTALYAGLRRGELHSRSSPRRAAAPSPSPPSSGTTSTSTRSRADARTGSSLGRPPSGRSSPPLSDAGQSQRGKRRDSGPSGSMKPGTRSPR